MTPARCRCGHERAAHEWAWCEGVCFPPGFPEVSCDCDAYKPAGDLYLVAGGSPATLALGQALDDPEVRARLEESVRQLAEAVGITAEAALRALAEAVEACRPAIEQAYGALRDAAVLPEIPPEDPRARALWLRQHRGTGPDRQVQHARRPRRIA